MAKKDSAKPLFRLCPSPSDFGRLLGRVGMEGQEGCFAVLLETSFVCPEGRDVDLDAPGSDSVAGYQVSEPLKGMSYISIDGLATDLSELFPGTGIGERGQWACFVDEQGLDGFFFIEGWTRDGKVPHLVHVKAPGRSREELLEDIVESECVKALRRGDGGRHMELSRTE